VALIFFHTTGSEGHGADVGLATGRAISSRFGEQPSLVFNHEGHEDTKGTVLLPKGTWLPFGGVAREHTAERAMLAAMKLKRPKTVLVLIVVFGWSFLKGIELLVRGSSSVDRMLYEEVGIGWLAVGLLTIIALLDLAAVRYLIKPAPIGRVLCLASIGLSAVQTSIGFAIARTHPDVVRRAFVTSRQSRGLPVRPEAIDAAADPTMLLLLFCGSLLVSGVLALLVIRNRNYFRHSSMPSTMPLQSTSGAGTVS
jgi:hypothetical protein